MKLWLVQGAGSGANGPRLYVAAKSVGDAEKAWIDVKNNHAIRSITLISESVVWMQS